MCESVGKADLLSDHFDGKQSRESVDLPLTCHPSPSLTSFVSRWSEGRRLLLDLDPYGCSDPLGIFPLFLKRTADVLAPRLSVVFRRLVRLCIFSACWRQANVTIIPKGPPSSSVANYRPISITATCYGRCLSAWCQFASDDLWNAVVCFQTPSLLIGKVWVPVMHFCACLIHCKVHWREGRQEARIVQIDFSAAFDRVNHQGILYKLCSAGIL